MALSFVSRNQWGAKPPKSVTKRSPKDLDGIAVHWFGDPRAAKTHDRCAEVLRSVQRGHMSPGGLGAPSGGADIAYNHGICPHGRAFTLRGFGVQTGANGTASANRKYAAVVYMSGEGDPLTEEAKPVLAEVIRMWREKGAGPLVKPHQFFTGSKCPGRDILKWLEGKPWENGGTAALAAAAEPVDPKDETPEWLIDFIFWRLADDGDPKKRPKGVPDRIPETAWEAAAQMHRMVNVMGPQDQFLDWAEWRFAGAKKSERPRSLPAEIPDPWWDALKRIQKMARKKK